MRGSLLMLLLLVPALSGCTDAEEGGFFDFLTGDDGIDGPCGHTYNSAWEKQIIIQVQWTKQTLDKVDPQELEVSATYFGETDEASTREARPYSEKNVDKQGCIAFPVDEPGGYSFWAFAEGDVQDCYVDGRLDGTFNGEDIVGGTLLIDRYFGGSHC